MRLLILTAACCLTLGTFCGSSAAAEPNFPYKAFINANEVYVRSGPGQSYYPTDKLTVGQEVEVYRHDPGGWYAIRPTTGSYSWISARLLHPTGNHLATVTEENVSARVGSRFSDVRDVVQVRLHKGEVVELLDSKQPAGDAGASAWCKIAPPAGEFRWVFSKYVDAEYPRDGLRRTGPADDASAGNLPREKGAAGKPTRPKRSGEARRDTAEAEQGKRAMSAAEFQDELDAIDLELATMVVEEPTVWSFDTVKQRAESLLDQAETAVERGRARLLCNKIAHFADLKQQNEAVASLERTNQQIARLNPPPNATAMTAARPAGAAAWPSSRFDCSGRLAEVRAPQVGGPRYALVDDSGAVLCYVSAAPGVSLRPYLGRQVGIDGVRGYMPEQHARHLVARHITPVDSNNGMFR
jgi:uncharacterized protein YraI